MTASRPLRIPLPPHFDFAWMLGFLAARTVPALEAVSPDEYRRSVRLAGQPVVLAVRRVRHPSRSSATPSGPARPPHVLVASASPSLPPRVLRATIARMFDLDVDLARFRRLASRDPILARVVAPRSGIRLPQLLDSFEGLVRAILGQQVSVAAASTVTDRLVRLFAGSPPVADAAALLPFPSAGDVADAGADRLRTIGLTRAKAATLAGAARQIADGTLDLEHLRDLPAADAQAALEHLPGIGPWTASYVRMRALGDRDAFPASDLGVIKALQALGVERQAIHDVAERWRPWRGYATVHLWASLGAMSP